MLHHPLIISPSLLYCPVYYKITSEWIFPSGLIHDFKSFVTCLLNQVFTQNGSCQISFSNRDHYMTPNTCGVFCASIISLYFFLKQNHQNTTHFPRCSIEEVYSSNHALCLVRYSIHNSSFYNSLCDCCWILTWQQAHHSKAKILTHLWTYRLIVCLKWFQAVRWPLASTVFFMCSPTLI